MIPKIHSVLSPNQSSRRGFRVAGTVIHYTADGPEWNPIQWLTMAESQASSHYVLPRNGDICRLVKLTQKAWHAGKSLWEYKGRPRRDVSRFTVGVELANAGKLTRDDKNGDFFWEAGRNLQPYRGPEPIEATLEFDTGTIVSGWWEPYDDRQIDSLQFLLNKFEEMGYSEAAHNLIGHEEISGPSVRGNSRFKIDPGPLFPWDQFSRKMPRSTKSSFSVAS